MVLSSLINNPFSPCPGCTPQKLFLFYGVMRGRQGKFGWKGNGKFVDCFVALLRAIKDRDCRVGHKMASSQ